VRRLLGVLLLCSSLVLAGAFAPPTPAPVPTPRATPAAMPMPNATAGASIPTVIVYPFDVQGGLDPKIGSAMASITAQAMTASGGLNVLPVPVGVSRPDFMSDAKKMRADYYISGYVTSVGEGASAVEQLVAVDSGIIIFSQTGQVSTTDDVASLSLIAREAILRLTGHAADQQVSTASGTPAPTSSNGAQVPIKGIGGIVDSVFGKHGKPGPSPSPTPLVKPNRGVIVARVAGTAGVSANDLTTATSLLYTAVNHYFTAQTTGVTTSVAQSADAICGVNRNNTIATGSMSPITGHGRGKTKATFTLSIYTCFGAQLDQQTGTGDSLAKAIAAAVAAYATAHPDNN
jgi:hypothetical protein